VSVAVVSEFLPSAAALSLEAITLLEIGVAFDIHLEARVAGFDARLLDDACKPLRRLP